MLIYTSDNGYFHGEHRIPKDKQHIYEESIRVPLLMRGPGIPQGTNLGPLVINADLAPTLVDLANFEPRPGHGRALADPGRATIPSIEQGRELLIEEPTFEAIRTERYMYAEYRTGERELYDLAERPVRARQPPQRPRLRGGQARLATGWEAANLRRLELPPPFDALKPWL